MIIKDNNYNLNIFYELNKFIELPMPLFLKLEGWNFAGSIKMKPALYMIESMERNGKIQPLKNTIIESSSGNLAIALAQVCHSRGYKFVAVIDINTTEEVIKLLKIYKAEIIIINIPDENGGFLDARIKKVNEIVTNNANYVWVNQYSNRDNIMSHYYSTAKEIISVFPEPDYLFVGTGTTGTLCGIAKYFNEFHPKTKIIGVDPVGSVTFSNNSSPRFIPGIGTSHRPDILSDLDMDNIHDIVWVHEIDAVKMCHRLLKEYSLLLGGSTGSIVTAVLNFKKEFNPEDVVIAISPDFGHKYIDTIYNSKWVYDKFKYNI